MAELVSFITPTFNRAYILGNAIESVLSQTYHHWELLVMDDGSTDNTKELVESFRDPRIAYHYRSNGGPSAARNSAFPLVQGDWIAYLDSDNELFPNYLEVMLAWIHRHPTTLYTRPQMRKTVELYKEGKLVQSIDKSTEDYPERMTLKDIFLRKVRFDGNGFMHSKKIIEEGFRFDENLIQMEEWDFLMQIGEKYPNNFLYVPIPLLHYHQRFGGDGIVSNTSYQQWADAFDHIYKKHKTDKMLEGQDWWPRKVEQYTKQEKEYRKGRGPSPQTRYFENSSNY